MDHELKQRLIGAVVITALAAIFVPMLFDDPVDTSGQTVTEQPLPSAPSAATAPETAQKLPQSKEQVVGKNENDLTVEVEEDAQVSTLDSQNMPTPNSTEPVQPGATGSNVSPGTVNQANQAVDDTGKAKTGEAPSLDTGYVGGKQEAEISQNIPAIKPVEPVQKPQQDLDNSVSKPVVKPTTAEKTKPAPDSTVARPVKPEKHSDKPSRNKIAKSGSKLVRYSIQAGSFNKKENAEALVAKLRKQGMPATVIAKGDYFRVKVGPSLDKAKANEMKAKLDKLKINGLLKSD